MRLRLPRAALVALCASVTVVAFATPGAVGAGAADVQVPSAYPDWNVPAPLGTKTGTLNVVATLADPSVAVATKNRGLSPGQQRQYAQELKGKQAAVVAQAQGLGATALAGVTNGLNAVVLRTDTSSVAALEGLDARPVQRRGGGRQGGAGRAAGEQQNQENGAHEGPSVCYRPKFPGFWRKSFAIRVARAPSTWFQEAPW